MDEEQSGYVVRWLERIHDDLSLLNRRVEIVMWLLAIIGVAVISSALRYAKWL